ncbi:MAG: MFS transporter, partial [Sphingomonadaceae bacterium]|nr:MFS transporter [Sphingomonadaceae bacterium]
TSPLAGGMIGGIVSREIILTVGWEWVFYGAGIVSLLILIPVAGLPESVRYLIAAGKRDELVGQIMRRIDPALPASPDTRYRVSTIDQQASRLRDLFGPGLAGTTLLLWIGVAANLFMTVLLIYWLPLLLEQQGVPLGTAIIATSILNGAGILGGITLAFLADRIGAPRVIVVASFAATVVVVLIGAVAPDMPATMIFVFLAGFLGLGSYAGFNVVSASVYPVRIRSAGVGWALSIGKTGAAAGPFAASTALEMQMPMSGIYAIAASAGLVAAAAILAISLRRRPEAPA